MDKILLYKKLASLPEELKAEVSDFIDFLKAKNRKETKKINLFLEAAKGCSL